MTVSHPDLEMIALGIRQPWIELILRGTKTIEVRSKNTALRGTIYLYASKKVSDIPAASAAVRKEGLDLNCLPRGLLLGTVELVDSSRCRSSDASSACVPRKYLKDQFAWHLRNPRRLEQPLEVKHLPYGVWFYPFRRKNRSPA